MLVGRTEGGSRNSNIIVIFTIETCKGREKQTGAQQGNRTLEPKWLSDARAETSKNSECTELIKTSAVPV